MVSFNYIKEALYVQTGKILHLDGDKRYTEKAYKHYKRANLEATVKNIEEKNQPILIKNMLDIYRPDILVATGHDAIINKEASYYDLYNYKNSKYFIQTVKKAREWDTGKHLVIFAGACQSFFEAIMEAGANFASSPDRILIDFADPLVVAETIAITDEEKYITIEEIAPNLRDGIRGIGGIGAKGKKKVIVM